MNILIIARGYPTKRYKTNGIFEFDQAKALAKIGHTVIYAAVDVRSMRRWRKWGFESFLKNGVHIEAINLPCGRIPRILLDRIQLWGLWRLYKRIEKKYDMPDIMHAHCTNVGSVGYLSVELKDKTNIPLVITEHSPAISKDIDSYLLEKVKHAYKRADTLIAVSPSLSRIIEKQSNIKPIYIANIVDTDLFTYVPKPKEKLYKFISVGSLTKNKRMDLIIDAFNEVFRNMENVTLTIFGDGGERSRLERLVQDYKLENRVKLMGTRSRQTIAEYLRESDCFVLPSRAETFGVVYIEALATGVPVIATRCGGPEEFVHEDNGILIDVDDIKGLTSAMLEMYYNIDRFDGKAISEETIRKFSPENIANLLTIEYEKNKSLRNG